MRKSRKWLISAAVLLVLGVGATIAYLVSSPATVRNTFTVGNVAITLQETTGTRYTLAPGVSLPKDPTVTVKAGSESSWLFVKVEKDPSLDAFCTYELQSEWIPLSGQDGVYYRQVVKTNTDAQYGILAGNCVTVKDTVTEQQLDGMTTYPTLHITAYAIQNEGIANAETAWQALQQ